MDHCVIFDCQSTGASPKYGNILELGWMPVNAEDGMTVAAPKSYLVKQSTPVPKVCGDWSHIHDSSDGFSENLCS